MRPDPARFFGGVEAAHQEALRSASTIERAFRVGPAVVRVRFAGAALMGVLAPAIEHLEVPVPPSEDEVTFAMGVFDSASTGVGIPNAPWSEDAYGPKGEVAGFNDARFRTVFQPGTDALNLADMDRRVGFYWIRSADAVHYWEMGAPFRSLLHWVLRDSVAQLVHAAAVGFEDGGLLLAGPGGSGKSTTALLCFGTELSYLGDDYVLVEADAPPRVRSLYQTAKVNAEDLARFPAFEPLVVNADALDREKAVLFPARLAADGLGSAFPIRAVLLPRVTGEAETRIRPATHAAALAALAPTTLFQLPGDSEEAFQKMASIVRSVPAYRIDLGSNVQRIPSVLAGFLRSGYPDP